MFGHLNVEIEYLIVDKCWRDVSSSSIVKSIYHMLYTSTKYFQNYSKKLCEVRLVINKLSLVTYYRCSGSGILE